MATRVATALVVMGFIVLVSLCIAGGSVLKENAGVGLACIVTGLAVSTSMFVCAHAITRQSPQSSVYAVDQNGANQSGANNKPPTDDRSLADSSV
jgi:hypothetical protein